MSQINNLSILKTWLICYTPVPVLQSSPGGLLGLLHPRTNKSGVPASSRQQPNVPALKLPHPVPASKLPLVTKLQEEGVQIADTTVLCCPSAVFGKKTTRSSPTAAHIILKDVFIYFLDYKVKVKI